MLAITHPSAVAKNQTSRTTAWAWLVEVQVDDTTAVRIVADYGAQVTYQGEVWYPLAAKL